MDPVSDLPFRPIEPLEPELLPNVRNPSRVLEDIQLPGDFMIHHGTHAEPLSRQGPPS